MAVYPTECVDVFIHHAYETIILMFGSFWHQEQPAPCCCVRTAGWRAPAAINSMFHRIKAVPQSEDFRGHAYMAYLPLPRPGLRTQRN